MSRILKYIPQECLKTTGIIVKKPKTTHSDGLSTSNSGSITWCESDWLHS